MYKFAVSLAAVAGLSPPITVWAQPSPEAIVVTASRSAESVDAALAPVTVITRESIEQSQARDLLELLQSHSVGLDIARSGGPGGNSSVFMRGSESDHLLVLIDGVKANSATSGAFDWNSLSPAQIERIEIVRGPNATLYGSAAIGGIVHIFTRKAEAPHADFSLGGYGQQSVAAGLGGKVGAGRFHLNANQQHSQGFSATNDKHPGYNPDRDGYDRLGANAGLKWPLASLGELALTLSQNEDRVAYDDSSVPTLDASADSRNRNANLRLLLSALDTWQPSISLGYSEDRLDAKDSFPATITTRRKLAGWQNDIQTGMNGLLIAGLEYEQEQGENSGNFDERSFNRAAYAQFQNDGEALRWKLGLRADEHSEYGRHSTGNLGLSLPLGAGRLLTSYGSAFKAPSFNERFYPWYGNPALKPEQSTSLELGYRLGDLRANLFRTRVEDLIAYDASLFMANNIDQATITGLELEYGLRGENWALETGLTLQDAQDDASDKPLLRRAKEKLFVRGSRRLGPHSDASLELLYTGPREDSFGFPSQEVELAAYTLVNLGVRYALNPHWQLKARIENLFDEDYELIYGYNTPGSSAYLGLQFN